MSDEVNLQRPFQIWLYSVTHSQLLLRSNRSNEQTTRVDILFKDIAAMELPTVFDGLSAATASEAETFGLDIQLGSKPIQDRNVFVVRGSNFVGYVVAGAVFWHEDEGQYYDGYFQKSFMSSRV
jgi:hypothetical protein